jgi:Tfp pilus assembly protein PilO
MLLGAEGGDVPNLDALLPAWAQDLSLVGILLIIIVSFIRGWVVTRGQAQRELDTERKIAEIWKTNFEQSTAQNQRLTEAFQPVLDQNAAILKAVEAVQARQLAQEERAAWLRDRRGPE